MPPPGQGEPLAKSSQTMLSRKGAAKKGSKINTVVKCRYFDWPIFISLNDHPKEFRSLHPNKNYYKGPAAHLQVFFPVSYVVPFPEDLPPVTRSPGALRFIQ
jgi:hypothetical protein